MKKFLSIFKNNIKLILGIVIGFIFFSSVVYADILFASEDVKYDNISSGLNSDNVQSAIDELYNKSLSCSSSSSSSDGYYYARLLEYGSDVYTPETSLYSTNYWDLINNSRNVFIQVSGENKYICVYIQDLSSEAKCFKENDYSNTYDEMYNYFGSYCFNDYGNSVYCNYGDFVCYADFNGYVSCYDSYSTCELNPTDGNAYCNQ